MYLSENLKTISDKKNFSIFFILLNEISFFHVFCKDVTMILTIILPDVHYVFSYQIMGDMSAPYSSFFFFWHWLTEN